MSALEDLVGAPSHDVVIADGLKEVLGKTRVRNDAKVVNRGPTLALVVRRGDMLNVDAVKGFLMKMMLQVESEKMVAMLDELRSTIAPSEPVTPGMPTGAEPGGMVGEDPDAEEEVPGEEETDPEEETEDPESEKAKLKASIKKKRPGFQFRKDSSVAYLTGVLRQVIRTDGGEWDEEAHPRAENGQFGSGGGVEKKSKSSWRDEKREPTEVEEHRERRSIADRIMTDAEKGKGPLAEEFAKATTVETKNLLEKKAANLARSEFDREVNGLLKSDRPDRVYLLEKPTEHDLADARYWNSKIKDSGPVMKSELTQLDTVIEIAAQRGGEGFNRSAQQALEVAAKISDKLMKRASDKPKVAEKIKARSEKINQFIKKFDKPNKGDPR